jgi:hypothetical protein
MENPKMPLKAWLQIAVIILAFVASLLLSHRLWSMGGRTVAVAPLILYTGFVTLYSVYMRHHRKV